MEGVLVVGMGEGQNFLAFPETAPPAPLSPEGRGGSALALFPKEKKGQQG